MTEAATALFVVCVAAGCVVSVLFCVVVSGAVTGMVAPEAKAVRELLGMLK